MIDNNINRFCELVGMINSLNNELIEERAAYYDGGYTFEEIHKSTIEELVSYQNELKEILKKVLL